MAVPRRLPRRRADPIVRRSTEEKHMRYLHTMIRIADIDASLDFYCAKLGLKEVRRYESEQGHFTLIFLAAPEDEHSGVTNKAPLVELTYNWDPEEYRGGRNFGHLAYEVDDIYATCQNLLDKGVTINRPPRDGHMAFVKSPDGISIELLQKGPAKEKAEPWASMPNTGSW
jgi:lactoylglutathione lyase